MDSMTFNKIAGGVIGALLVFLLLSFFSGMIYGTREVAHHDDEVLAFALDIGGEAEVAEVEEEVDVASLVQNASIEDGEKTFRACQACHKLEEGANAVGPHLWGVVGRDIAAVGGYSYSDALADKEGDWDLAALDGFLENPNDWAPGTKMSYAGLDDPQDRVDLIAYLNEVDGSPIDLSEGLETMGGALATAESGETGSTDTTAVEMVNVEEGDVEVDTPPVQIIEDEDAPVEVPLTEEKDVDPAARPATAPAQSTEEQVAVSPVQGVVEEAPTAEGTPLIGESALGADEDTTDTGQPPAEEEVAAAPPPAAPAGSTEQQASQPAAGEQSGASEKVAEQGTEVAAAASTGAFAGGDAAAGEKIFRRCRACHVVDAEQNRVGPHLVGVVGRDIAAVEDFNYSDALSGKEGAWTGSNLSAYLENPKAWAPGNKMAFAGLKDEQDRIDVITYLNEADGSPEPLE